MTTRLPDDLVKLPEAARLVERSTDTVRRWRREHGLRDYRDKRDKTAPSLFSQGELLALAARLAVERAAEGGFVDGVVVPVGVQGVQAQPRPPAPDAGGQALVSLVHGLLSDLRAERDRLTEQLTAERSARAAEATARATATAQLGEAMAELLALGVRVERLETLLAYGTDKALAVERRRLRRAREAPPAEGAGEG